MNLNTLKNKVGLVQFWMLYVGCIFAVPCCLWGALLLHEWKPLIGVVGAPIAFWLSQPYFLLNFGSEETKRFHQHVRTTRKRFFRGISDVIRSKR